MLNQPRPFAYREWSELGSCWEFRRRDQGLVDGLLWVPRTVWKCVDQPIKLHNALSGADDEHDSYRAGEDGATMVQPISQDADAPFQGANLPFYNRAAAPS